MLELLPQIPAAMPSALRRSTSRLSNGTAGAAEAVTTIDAGTMPLSVNHSGQVPAVTISFDLRRAIR